MTIPAECIRLHALGFAIHWLRPRSKIPLEGGWTRGPRKTLKELKISYQAGYNIGVRLGQASHFDDGGYLAVIDCDVKSSADRDRIEMEKALSALGIPPGAPEVISGRGNGSRHLYIRTQTPAAFRLYAQSQTRVKVSMPSVKASKNEIKILTEKEIQSGVRLRHAWEISILGEGRQVVLPPSIHPDSGRAYQWAHPLVTARALPWVKLEASSGDMAPEADKKLLSDFKAVPVDLVSSAIPDSTLAMILQGEGVSDRSASLFSACIALLKAGFKDVEILSVLTDPDLFLGAVAYDHAQTRSRARAAQWLSRYTLTAAKTETSAEMHFKGLVVDESEVQELEAVAQADQAARDAPVDWRESESRGFYSQGARGALKPEYGALLAAFEAQHPFRSIADMKTVYVFKDTHYTAITSIEIKAFAEAKFNPKPENVLRNEFEQKVFSNNVTLRDFFTQSTEGKINFKNGVLDLTEGSWKLLPHSENYGFRGVLPYVYDPEAQCPVFREWIKSVMMDDTNLVDILQEFMGYVVRGGSYKYHKALWLEGVGRNGKSTFIDLLKELIGIQNFSVLSIKNLTGDKFAGADLDGKIANFSEETSPQELADSGPFKNLTGDGDIYAQKKYGNPYTFRNRAKLIMSYNQIPELKDLSPGMLSRPIIIPFKKTIKEEEQDRTIKEKLFKELSGIFNFALAGWSRLESQGGFTKSDQSILALQNLKDESCPVFQWLSNAVEPVDADTPGAEGLTGSFGTYDLYGHYSRAERYPLRFVEFKRRLHNHPLWKTRKKRFNEGMRLSEVRIKV